MEITELQQPEKAPAVSVALALGLLAVIGTPVALLVYFIVYVGLQIR